MRVAIISIAILGFALGSCNGGSGGANEAVKWKTISPSANSATNTAIASEEKIIDGGFTANLPEGFAQPTDDVGRKLLREYGSVYVARGGVTPPKTVVFKDEAELSKFRSSISSSRETIAGVSIELQSAAMQALKDAAADAKQSGASITPRGTDAAKRNYKDTVDLWESRVEPGLAYWVGQGRISTEDAQRIRSLLPYEQVPEIFKLESKGIYFAKDFSKSIIYSVAPPGSSQHLSMLALDVSENANSDVRQILAKHGWFQTVVSDLPHFTFLGVPQTELAKLGLKKVTDSGRTFWVPDI